MASGRKARLFIQFAREPAEGRVKTRLIGHLTPRQACELHCELVQRTCTTLLAAGLADVELAVTGGVGHPLFQRCSEQGARICLQRGADLGERMYHAISAGLEDYEQVLLVGSDCPDIDAAYLRRALRLLETASVVLGPALDGGYVLIGAREIDPAVFSGVEWGRDTVLAETVARLDRLGLAWAELPVLADIDRPEDLQRWRGR